MLNSYVVNLIENFDYIVHEDDYQYSKDWLHCAVHVCIDLMDCSMT